MKGEELSVKAKGMKVRRCRYRKARWRAALGTHPKPGQCASVKAVGPHKLFEPFPHRWKIHWTKWGEAQVRVEVNLNNNSYSIWSSSRALLKQFEYSYNHTHDEEKYQFMPDSFVSKTDWNSKMEEHDSEEVAGSKLSITRSKHLNKLWFCLCFGPRILENCPLCSYTNAEPHWAVPRWHVKPVVTRGGLRKMPHSGSTSAPHSLCLGCTLCFAPLSMHRWWNCVCVAEEAFVCCMLAKCLPCAGIPLDPGNEEIAYILIKIIVRID